MTLDAYMTQHCISRAEMASRLGVSVEAVRRWTSGERTPRPMHMAAIKRVTRGAVTADSFVAGRDAA